MDMICIDVLHALDLGLSQEMMGNMLFESFGPFAIGRNRKSQLEDLVLKMKDHYRRFRTGNKIGALTEDMVRRQGKAPKLRAKGAETRHLVPFGVEIACAMHAANPTTHTLTVYKLASALLDFYTTLGIQPFPVKDAKSACRSICCLYVALHDEAVANGKTAWAVKPKLHLFQELGEYMTETMGDPKSYWCYLGEDFVGLMAIIGFSRGGGRSPEALALDIINRFRALSA